LVLFTDKRNFFDLIKKILRKNLKSAIKSFFFREKIKKQRVVFSLFPFFDKKTKKNAFFKMRKKISAVLNSSKKYLPRNPPYPQV